MNEWRKTFVYLLIAALGLVSVSFALVPNSTPVDTTMSYLNGTSVVRADYVVIDGDIFQNIGGTLYNVTAVIENLLGLNATNEWGLVYGTTGDWFNYTEITANPIYLGLQMHQDNLFIGGEYLIPNVYDKDDYHWQLELVWMSNGTQCNKDCLVMYYAHVEWGNTSDTPILPNDDQEPV